MIFFCIHMFMAVGNDTEHIPNINTDDGHCPSEARPGPQGRPPTGPEPRGPWCGQMES